MKIALFGATGGTGRHFLTQALEAEHDVAALVRDAAKLDQVHDGLRVIQGNVLEAVAVSDTLADAAVAMVILGNTADNPDDIVSQGTAVIIAAMQELGQRRLVILTSLGVGDSVKQIPLAFKVAVKTIPVLKNAMADKEIQERMVMESGLDWTIVRPGGLSDGPLTGTYTSGLDPKIKARQLSRADVAHYLLQVMDDDGLIGKAPAVT